MPSFPLWEALVGRFHFLASFAGIPKDDATVLPDLHRHMTDMSASTSHWDPLPTWLNMGLKGYMNSFRLSWSTNAQKLYKCNILKTKNLDLGIILTWKSMLALVHTLLNLITLKRDINRLLCSSCILLNITDCFQIWNTEQCNSKDVIYHFINSKKNNLYLWRKVHSDVIFTIYGLHHLFLSRKWQFFRFLWESKTSFEAN